MQTLKTLIIGSGKLANAIDKQMQHDLRFAEVRFLKRGQKIDLTQAVDCIVDVSTSGALKEHLPDIILLKKPLIIGTTGQTQKEIQEIKDAAKHIPILLSQNFSEGIFRLTQALQQFQDDSYEYSITEIHHSEKKDQPSGTAKLLRNAIDKQVPIKSIRQGDEIGEHTISIKMHNETLTLTHQAQCRSIFAKGALKSCLFLLNKSPGLYTNPYE